MKELFGKVKFDETKIVHDFNSFFTSIGKKNSKCFCTIRILCKQIRFCYGNQNTCEK